MNEISNSDKDFYRELIKEQNKNMKENNKILTTQLSVLDEIKISLQSKPCIIPDTEKKINEGWKDNTVKMYRTLLIGASSLFAIAVVSFIILAFGKEFIGQELTATIIKHLLKMP